MKKTKTFGKAQVALAVMVVALAAAVGLNMKYSAEQEGNPTDTSSKYLGQAEYVNASVSGESDDSSSNAESSYFTQLRKDRKESREEALDILEETLDRTDLSEAERAETTAMINALAQATDQEAGIETVLKAKGFKNVVAVIGENDVNIIVDGELDTAKTTQIQDAVISQTNFAVADIKIISSQEK